MDPALWETIRLGGSADEVEAIVRLDNPTKDLSNVRIVSRYGSIATCRIQQNNIVRTHELPDVASLKAARLLGPELEPHVDSFINVSGQQTQASDIRRPTKSSLTGKGVLVGVADWFFDVNHPNLKWPDGSTKIRALWDQRTRDPNDVLMPYGYGRLLTREVINTALLSSDPYIALDYHPGETDRNCRGSHGTHTADIAAGSGVIGPAGVAPEAELILVHLADKGTGGLANLGDSVRILEAVDFISKTAGANKCSLNLSVGRHGGPHTGETLAEKYFDAFLSEVPGRCIAQSAGNYHSKSIHSVFRLKQGESRTLSVVIDEADLTANELEIWTTSKNCLSIQAEAPDGTLSKRVPLGESCELFRGDHIVGAIYNREADPNSNRDNHIDMFLYPAAQSGLWKIHLSADRASDGVFHAWLERDDACARCQTHFLDEDADPRFTTGTLASSRGPLVVGAFNAHSPDREIASFSSSGPTRDNRIKPDLVAPGVSVLAARSYSDSCDEDSQMLVRKSGTSMAAPNVCGVAALCLQASSRPLWNDEIRRLILDNTESIPAGLEPPRRIGRGYLDTDRVIRALARPNPKPTHRTTQSVEQTITTPMEIAMKSTTDQLPMIDAESVFREAMSADASENIADNLSIVARPGQMLESPPQEGDLLVRIAQGEPGLSMVSRILKSSLMPDSQLAEANMDAESMIPGFYLPVADTAEYSDRDVARRILDAEGRMPPYQLLLRPNDTSFDVINAGDNLLDIDDTMYFDDDDLMDNLEGRQQEVIPLAVGAAVAGAFAGAVFTPLVSGIINRVSGGFTIGPASASHIWRQSPAGLPLYRRIDKLRFPLEKLGFDKLAVFNLELTFDGHSVHEAAITFRSGASSRGFGDFKAVFRAQPLGGSAPSGNNVLQILFPFSGNWNPAGPGNEDFTGSVVVSGNGRVRARMQPRADNVRIHHSFGQRRILRRARPQPPTPGPTPITVPVPVPIPTPVPTPRPRRRGFSFRRAISQNCKWGCKLGWLVPQPGVLRVLELPKNAQVDRAFVEALKRWQSQNSLSRDGVMGPNTWEKMQQAIAALPPETPAVNVQRAVQQNRILSESLGWKSLRGAISLLIGITNQSPTEEAFAEAVARWQSQNSLTADGIIGQATWDKMRPFLTSG